MHELAYGEAPVPMERSHEYCTRILNAIETNEPYTCSMATCPTRD